MPEFLDTISAIATPSGRGGVSIVRISGPAALAIAQSIIGFSPRPRYAHYSPFLDREGGIIDTGVILYFRNPHSFTGEDVVEFQAHGGPFVVDRLLNETLAHGARIARPGEFSERAFLNNKIDLTQAEAIADLIESHSEEASKYALRSLQGEFSNLINKLVASITELRVYIEAAIDFPEEEIDFLSSGNVMERLRDIQKEVDDVLARARLGSVMKEGLKVVIAGEPNAGKSSLLNVLSGQTTAIVTEIAGTTRDTLREHISIDGIPLHIIDTAGLRTSDDIVEREGIRRAWEEVKNADHVLFLQDSSKYQRPDQSPLWVQLTAAMSDLDKLTIIQNKIDLTGESPAIETHPESGRVTIRLSATEQAGIDLLRTHLKREAGFSGSEEGGFIARRRHLDALRRAQRQLQDAEKQLRTHKAGELVAEDLRAAQQSLSEITGEFTPDDLLGEIFSSFCIGK